MKKSLETAIRRFSQQYGDTPGILKIDKDNFFSDSILVFIDKLKFKSNLPTAFEDFDVSLYDVRNILKATNEVLNLAKEEGYSASSFKGDARSTYDYFVQTSEICKKMLSK